MSGIRLIYSGMVMFVVRILSIVTGMLLMIIITRNLPVEEVGIFGNINDLLAYFLLFSNIIPFWSKRNIARKERGSVKTGVIANIIISLIFSAAYLLAIPYLFDILGIEESYLLVYGLAAILILEMYLSKAIEAPLHITKPQYIGYGVALVEISKLLLGYFFIAELKFGLYGVIYTYILSNLIQICYTFLLTKEEILKDIIRLSYIKKWLKTSFINLIRILGQNVTVISLLLLFMYGGEGGRGIYAVAYMVASSITYVWYIAFSIYPKLLTGGSRKDVEVILKMILMFATPMLFGIIFLSDSFLVIFSKEYVEARYVLVLLT
ncbi:MAG TPA: hypothetical protein ENF41_03880, partial [Candidatus Bathyarchaeota archaeon]|nr:hypothetical protein [Candidatus Bathyarchaeota archaeon]